MKSSGYILKILVWSLSVSIGMRIIFGLYAVFGFPILIFPLAAGAAAAISFAPPGSGGLVAASSIHMILVTVLSAVFDVTGILRKLPFDCADFFARAAGMEKISVSIFKSILFVMPVYFLSFILFSVFISSRRFRKKSSYNSYSRKIYGSESRIKSRR